VSAEDIKTEELYEDLAEDEKTREPKGNHSLLFNVKDIIKLKDGTEINMGKEGFAELEKFLNTKSPTMMSKRLVVIARRVNKARSDKEKTTEKKSTAK